MKVIFLDCDGVINSTTAPAEFSSDWLEASPIEYVASQIDEEKVTLLNYIIEKTGALVVLSSSWKDAHPLEIIRRAFESKGFKGMFIGTTRTLGRNAEGEFQYRADEIEEWVDAVGVKDFVILDDIPMRQLASRAIHTTMEEGLTQEQAERAIRLLS